MYPGSMCAFQMRSLQLGLRTEPPILAYDGDLAINQPLSYGITSGNSEEHFSIDESTGELTLIKTFDREQMDDVSTVDNPSRFERSQMNGVRSKCG